MAYSIERMPERISIGRETETGVTDVMIDCGAWVSKWPGMALHAIHTPEGGAPYILQTETDGGVLVWHVTDADTATPGTGRMEIVGETDGQRKVSAMVKVSVAARMGGAVGHPPEAAQPWVDRVVEASERITGMQAQAKTLDAGSGATAEWNGEQGLLTIGVPKGEKGAPGKDAVVDATLTQSGQAADAKATGDALALKLTEPSTGLAVGKYFRIAAIDESGHAVLEAVDLPSAPVQDVQINGTSIVADGLANVPNATNNAKGVIRGNTSIVDSNFAVSSGSPYCMTRNASDFYSQGQSGFVSNGTLRNVLTAPSLMPSLTAEEQAAARARIGLPGNWELIEQTTITDKITVFERTTEPNGNPYNFVSVVMQVNFSGIPSDVEYNASTYAILYNGHALYDYFTERKINSSQSLWSYVDCSGKCPNFNSFVANNSGSSIVTMRTGFINTLANQLKCRAAVINTVRASGLFPAGVKFTIWGVRA